MIKRSWLVLLLLSTWGYTQTQSNTKEAAEYYLAAYANHYGVPLAAYAANGEPTRCPGSLQP